MIYLASPYSSPDPLIMRTRFLLAEQVTAQLLGERKHVYSPIVHCHELAMKYKLPTDFEFWKKYNFDFLRRADTFYVLEIDGWETSKGVTVESNLAATLDIPRFSINPDGIMHQLV
jgi:hypothetical protein